MKPTAPKPAANLPRDLPEATVRHHCLPFAINRLPHFASPRMVTVSQRFIVCSFRCLPPSLMRCRKCWNPFLRSQLFLLMTHSMGVRDKARQTVSTQKQKIKTEQKSHATHNRSRKGSASVLASMRWLFQSAQKRYDSSTTGSKYK